MKQTRVLAVFANPKGSDPLRLGAEDRIIRECLTRSKYRDSISLEIRHATTIHDLRRALLDEEYDIIQFSGHGTGRGLALEDGQGEVHLVPPEALAELLSVYSPPIECVIMNACYSDTQGRLVSSLGVPYTIAMDGPISDESATEFTRGFYDAIGAGKDAEFAYQEGCRTIKLVGLQDGIVPVLLRQSAPSGDLRKVHFAVEVGDVTNFDADVIGLKFANTLFGADSAVASALGKTEDDILKALPVPGEYELFQSLGRIKAKQVLFLNVGYLHDFDYAAIRRFAAAMLEVLAKAAVSTRHLAMTVHGVGYGLDESEAVRAQLAGYLDAFDSGHCPPGLELITIVERNPDRARRLHILLNDAILGGSISLPQTKEASTHTSAIERSLLPDNVGRESSNKSHVFVAMSFAEEMEDVYHYGIRSPVNAAGYLCERADLVPFTGDILERIKERIETASLVIAELSNANPNVFLEVGYAWGKERPTILLARDEERLPFDVRGQRCLMYKKIRDLEELLEKELVGLKSDLN